MCHRGYARALGFDGVRRLTGLLVVALTAAGCRGAASFPTLPAPHSEVLIKESPSPLTLVSAGAVRTVIPDRWQALSAGSMSAAEHGVVASNRPDRWMPSATGVEGMAAFWIDGTEVGVPSDYYYLAATGPALSKLTHSPDCNPVHQRVYVDHRPEFAQGIDGSPGDYVAMGQGVCTIHRTATRFRYFVAAPGYGPVRTLGIPRSSLYVVVAVLRDGPRAAELLEKLVFRTQFGDASVAEIIAVAKAATI